MIMKFSHDRCTEIFHDKWNVIIKDTQISHRIDVIFKVVQISSDKRDMVLTFIRISHEWSTFANCYGCETCRFFHEQ